MKKIAFLLLMPIMAFAVILCCVNPTNSQSLGRDVANRKPNNVKIKLILSTDKTEYTVGDTIFLSYYLENDKSSD